MRTGLTTSVILHAVALAFGLFTLSAPPALRRPPMSKSAAGRHRADGSRSRRSQQGDKKAVMHEKPAPMPTQRPDIVPDAQKVGENSVDTDKPMTPEAKPKPVDTAAAPPPAPTPVEKPKPEDVPKPKEKPKPVPATEVAPAPQPKEEVKPEPVKQAEPKPTPAKPAPTPPPQDKTAAIEPKPEVKPDAVAEAIAAGAADRRRRSCRIRRRRPKLGRSRSRPRPKAPRRRTARTPTSRSRKPRRSRSRTTSSSTPTRFPPCSTSRSRPAAAPSARPSRPRSAATRDQGQKLSQVGAGALEAQLRRLLDPAGRAGEVRRISSSSVRFNLDASGKLTAARTVEKSSGNRPFDESAVRAVQKCDVARPARFPPASRTSGPKSGSLSTQGRCLASRPGVHTIKKRSEKT